MATLYYTETVHIAQTQTQITIPYFCVGQESESESVPESISGNVNEPLDLIWDTWNELRQTWDLLPPLPIVLILFPASVPVHTEKTRMR